MIKYTSTRQISIEEFKTPFARGLDKNNRWVRLAQKIPWDEFARIYGKALCKGFGRPSVNARVVIGAMIIKHKKCLPDEATIEEIQENAYLQYFLGYEEFRHDQAFDPSLFVTIRKRIGQEAFEEMNQALMATIEIIERSDASKTSKKKKKNKSNKDQLELPSETKSEEEKPNNQGQLLLDAVVAPQDIKFPTDHDLLNEAREHTERIIDILYQPSSDKRKPRTYRRIARKVFLAIAHKKQNSKKTIRKAIRKQLSYVRRNIETINNLLGPSSDQPLSGLCFRDLRIFWIIQELYRQQKQMFDQRIHKISDRIVSISQPHVRPIVRGKAGKNVEFGAKLSASLINGFVFLDHLCWDAFNESTDLIDQVERYHSRFNIYPEVVIVDKIYGTRDNRKYLNEEGIRFSGKALERPPKLTTEMIKSLKAERCRRKEEGLLRNRIEGKFGEGKRKYDLDCIMAKTMKTSESWISAIFFVMNIAHWMRVDFFVLVWNWLKNASQRFLFDVKEQLCFQNCLYSKI